MDLASKLFKGDRVIWIIFMFLCLISVVEVFSATSTIAYKNANHWAPIVRHATFLLGGFVMVLLLHNIPCRFFSAFIILLPVSMLMLIVTPFIGVDANDAHRWLEIMGIQFQPSEFGKLACVVFVAFLLSKRGKLTENQIFKYILIGVGLTCVLILPENFSTAFMLFGVCFLMMFIGQLPFGKLAKLAGILMLALVLFLVLLKFTPAAITQYLPDRFVTWQGRLERFFDGHKDNLDESGTYKITDDNYQVTHAKIAIARGGVLGQMPGHGQQRDFLPQAYSDFIYAIIIEELGIVGGIFVLLLYIMLLVRVGMIARKCDKSFPKFLVLGCGLLVVVQALANMAVAVNLVPVTGQPMPLVSRGGTSTLISCIYFGIILSVSRFGANIGNEDEEEEDTENPENPSDEPSGETINQAVEGEREDNPLSDAEILFVGAEDRMEMDKVPAAGYKIVGLPVSGFDRAHLMNNVKVMVRLAKSLRLARKTIREFKPDIAVGVGGYASGPTLWMAASQGVPALIQEQNSYAGVTNKLLAKKASKICVAYEGMEKFFPADKIVITGNPVRQDLEEALSKKEEALAFFGLSPEKKTILVVGGSLGARTINRSIQGDLDKFFASDVQVIWQTGRYYYSDASKHLKAYRGMPVWCSDFITRMDYAYSAADLVISRAGASSISELCLLGKPVVLVPSPNVAEDHQTKNALALVHKDAAVMIADKDAEKDLVPTALKIVHDDERLRTLSRNIETLAQRHSADRIVDEIVKIIDKK